VEVLEENLVIDHTKTCFFFFYRFDILPVTRMNDMINLTVSEKKSEMSLYSPMPVAKFEACIIAKFRSMHDTSPFIRQWLCGPLLGPASTSVRNLFFYIDGRTP
jgi:hypothetical protein